jgi:hypothetical protein
VTAREIRFGLPEQPVLGDHEPAKRQQHVVVFQRAPACTVAKDGLAAKTGVSPGGYQG